MYDIPVFQELLKKDVAIGKEFKAFEEAFTEAMGECPEGGEFDEVMLEFQAKTLKLQNEMQSKKYILARNWYRENI